LNPQTPAGAAQPPATTRGPRIWVEVDDLVRYLESVAVPSAGIARVQMETLPRLLSAYPDKVGICRVGASAEDVRVIAPDELLALFAKATSARTEGDISAPARLFRATGRYVEARLRAIHDRLVAGPAARRRFFDSVQPGDIILALGGSWTHTRFGQSLRTLKARYGVRFAILIHDVLPISHPQFVAAKHTPNFERWLDDMRATWDFVLTPSQASADLLTAHLLKIGAPVPPIRPIPFGFGFSNAADPAESPIETEPYVLFVSTFDIRKNHALAYRIWERLIAAHGADAVPNLVFAGGKGWGMHQFWHDMHASNGLNGKIRVFTNLTDAEIARGYEDCKFSIFPSFCEGWGLPVSESLSHGKLCVASNATSIPEIGGEAVDYFDPYNEDEAYAAVERALFQPGYLEAREAYIRDRFRPPIWDDTARAIVEVLGALANATDAQAATAPEASPLPQTAA
jgi:glycosyltransferase involved in cell wall biosynthesis